MIELILSLIPGGSITAAIAAGLATLAGMLGIYRAGRSAERTKNRAKEADAYEQHLREISDAHSARNRVDPDRVPSDDPYRRD